MAKKSASDKNDNLQKLLAEMEKEYGKGIIMTGDTKLAVESVSTGSHRFDKITNCGGIPIGKLVEIYGPESSGKSTISLHIIAEFQKRGLKCLLCDYEYSFDANYAKIIGVDINSLYITQPETMEDGYNIIYDYVKSGEIGAIIIDSHTAMVPACRLDGKIGDAKMAPEARVNSESLKKIKPLLEPNKCTLIGISQLRANIGGMGMGDVPTGGNAWKFYSDMRVKVYKQLDRPNETNKTTIEIVKNKCGKPYGKDTIQIAWGIGIDKVQEIIDLCVKYDIIKQSGSWYTYNGNSIGQGVNAVKELLMMDSVLYSELQDKALLIFNNSNDEVDE